MADSCTTYEYGSANLEFNSAGVITEMGTKQNRIFILGSLH